MVSIDFTDQWEHGDIKLTVIEDEEEDGKILYANQGVLSVWSPVFAAMFKDGKFKEGSTREVKLPGKNYENVLELLKVLHPPNSPVTLRNAYELLLLAHEYQIQGIVRRCEDTIITDNAKVSNIKLADDYGLERLRKHCVDNIGSYFPLDEITGDKDYATLSETSKHDLLCKRISTIEAKIVKDEVVEKEKPSQALYGPSACSSRFRGSPVTPMCDPTTCDQHKNMLNNTDCEKCKFQKLKSFYKSLFSQT